MADPRVDGPGTPPAAKAATEPAAALVPPRPNPGPEPYKASTPSAARRAGLAAALALVLLAAWLAFRRFRRRRRARTRPGDGPAAGAVDAPRPPIVVMSGEVREALVARFGEGWRAKTTEEIEVDPALAAAFGPETAARLSAFLREADRAKFALAAAADPRAGTPPPADPDGWAAWVGGFVAGARAPVKAK